MDIIDRIKRLAPFAERTFKKREDEEGRVLRELEEIEKSLKSIVRGGRSVPDYNWDQMSTPRVKYKIYLSPKGSLGYLRLCAASYFNISVSIRDAPHKTREAILAEMPKYIAFLEETYGVNEDGCVEGGRCGFGIGCQTCRERFSRCVNCQARTIWGCSCPKGCGLRWKRNK